MEEPGLDAPIFIVGAPRNGTTLLRNMLNRHPAITICRETVFFDYFYPRRRTFGSLSELRNRQSLIREYLSTQYQSFSIRYRSGQPDCGSGIRWPEAFQNPTLTHRSKRMRLQSRNWQLWPFRNLMVFWNTAD
jgi:hypothetical protein